MAATAEQVLRLRRMVNEPSATSTYSDDDLEAYIERYPVTDARGEEPLIESTTTPYTLEANDYWIATYDLNQAAAAIWQEKAGQCAGAFDFMADGGYYYRNQAYKNALAQARYYSSRRTFATVTLQPAPREVGSEDASNG